MRNDARFTEAKVVERICAATAGRWTTEQILGAAEDFLASGHVVRLVPELAAARRRPPEWSTVAHRRLENTVLDHLDRLVATPTAAVPTDMVEAAVSAEGPPRARPGRGGAGPVRRWRRPGAEVVAMARGLASPSGTVDDTRSWLEVVERGGRLLEEETVTLDWGISRDQGMELGL